MMNVDGKDIAKVEDISVGVGALLGIYFIFGVKYAENVKNTPILYRVNGW